ncbi:ABC transporter substrate-binding protein [Cellulomonas alba]|uniref:ABC transporter substrate-binding protein n=1 Tax=Cellulomonas alba TaxID=3053467 RepID=A0ABT7SKE9_9CELL|nr:ABC transporter substrate-binding protein [Cellulomonas alba]MDM7856007.1 ABC transporter substrate-binding protein [Cellulomonas alba]
MTVRPKSSRAVRRTALVIAAALATTGLAACSGSSGHGASVLNTEAPVTLTWWTGQPDSANELLQSLAKDFTKLHPNVKIVAEPGASSTDDLLQKMSAGFAGGTYPDISYAFGSWASQLEGSGRTLDLTEQVKDPAVKWDELPAAARATAQPSGHKTIGFPALVDNLSLLYNKTVFDSKGVAYPTKDWTWDDLRAAAKKLTDSTTQTYGFGYSVSGTEETTWQFWPHLWQRGGQILSADQKTATFADKPGVDALTFLRSMAQDDKSLYLDQTDTKIAQLFAADRIAMETSGPWALHDLQVAGTKYGVVQLPGFDGSHQTVSGPDLWVALDHKDVNRAHWTFEFLNWLTSPAQDLRWNVAYGNLPLRASEQDSPEFKKQVADLPGLDVMAANSANATTARPTVPGYVGLSEAIGTAISQVLQGKGDPAEALQKAQTDANTALASAAK